MMILENQKMNHDEFGYIVREEFPVSTRLVELWLR